MLFILANIQIDFQICTLAFKYGHCLSTCNIMTDSHIYKLIEKFNSNQIIFMKN